MARLFPKVNVVLMICDHLLGEKHDMKHRRACGGSVMVTGVLVAKSAVLIHYTFWHIGVDVLGYFIHGLGAVPFFEHFIELSRHKSPNNPPSRSEDDTH